MAPEALSLGEGPNLPPGVRPKLLIEVEVPRRALLEPEAVLLGRVAEEVGGLLEHILAAIGFVYIPGGDVRLVPNVGRRLNHGLSGDLPFKRLHIGAGASRGVRFILTPLQHGLHVQLGGLLDDRGGVTNSNARQREIGIIRERLISDRSRAVGAWGRSICVANHHSLRGEILGDGYAAALGALVSRNGLQGLPLLTSDLTRIGASTALQFQVLADGVIEQSHCADKPYCARAFSSMTTLGSLAYRHSTRVYGAIAQLGERLDRTQEVGGSSPPSSISKDPCTSAGSRGS